MADIIGLGELLVDFTPAGVSASGLPLIEQNPGGAPANCLAAAAKQGVSTAFIGKVGDDPHGRFLKGELERAGVSAEGLKIDPDCHTTLAFVSLKPDGEREFSFIRNPGADTRLKPEEIDEESMRGCKVFHVGSLSLTHEPARTATWNAVVAVKAAGAAVSYDPNYRAMLWPDEAVARDHMQSLLPVSDIVKLSEEELYFIAETDKLEVALDSIRSEGPSVIAVTMGAKGALIADRESMRMVEGFPAVAVDATGAGDAFLGGFLAAFVKSGLRLDDVSMDDLAEFARVGCATAAICVARRGGMPAMPAMDEVEGLLSR